MLQIGYEYAWLCLVSIQWCNLKRDPPEPLPRSWSRQVSLLHAGPRQLAKERLDGCLTAGWRGEKMGGNWDIKTFLGFRSTLSSQPKQLIKKFCYNLEISRSNKLYKWINERVVTHPVAKKLKSAARACFLIIIPMTFCFKVSLWHFFILTILVSSPSLTAMISMSTCFQREPSEVAMIWSKLCTLIRNSWHQPNSASGLTITSILQGLKILLASWI